MTNHDVGTDHCRVMPPGENEGEFIWFEYYRHLYAYYEAGNRIDSNFHILEIGSGEGYGINYLSSVTRHIVGTDISLQTLRHAKSRYPHVQFCQALGTSLPFTAGIFDAVFSFQVIEHIQDVKSYLHEIYSVLKPGAILFLTTPNRKLRLLPFQKPWNPYHIREYCGDELYLLLNHWFEPLQIYGVMAQPELMAMERARVKQSFIKICIKVIYQWLKKILPDIISQKMDNLASMLQQKPKYTKGVLKSIGLQDFFLSTDLDNSLDLFIIAEKPK